MGVSLFDLVRGMVDAFCENRAKSRKETKRGAGLRLLPLIPLRL